MGSHPAMPCTLHSGLAGGKTWSPWRNEKQVRSARTSMAHVTTDGALRGGCTFERPCPGATGGVKTNGTQEEPMMDPREGKKGAGAKQEMRGKKNKCNTSNGEVFHAGNEPDTALSHDCDEHCSIDSTGSAPISINPRLYHHDWAMERTVIHECGGIKVHVHCTYGEELA